MTGFRADETNQYSGFRIFVGKNYDPLNQIQQQTLVMIQDLGERGRMDSPMVSQRTAGRISESTAINENDVRLVYLLWESSTQSLDQNMAILSHEFVDNVAHWCSGENDHQYQDIRP